MAEDPAADATRPGGGGPVPDDAALEAAMAALLKRSFEARGVAGSASVLEAPAGPGTAGHGTTNGNGNGNGFAEPVGADVSPGVDPVWGDSPADANDLSVSAWAPAPDVGSDPSDFALREAGFDTETHAALADLRDLTQGGPEVPGAAAGAEFIAEGPELSRRARWAEKRQEMTHRFGLEDSAWSSRRKDLVPALVVAVLVVLGLVAVITSLTRGKGSDTAVKSTTASTEVTTTTVFSVSVPPPPGPLPVDSTIPDTSTSVASKSSGSPKAKKAPAKSSPSGGSQPAAPAPTSAPGDTTPSTTAATTPVTTPTTSPTTTPTTSPEPTTTLQPPTDLCLNLPQPQRDICENRGR